MRLDLDAFNELNEQLEIICDDRDESGASHNYLIWLKLEGRLVAEISFQHGPINVVGANGASNEALIWIVLDRLRGFQTTKYACQHNERAIAHLELALESLQARTLERQHRGVEGTHEV